MWQSLIPVLTILIASTLFFFIAALYRSRSGSHPMDYFWFGLMALGAVAAVSGGVARLATDNSSVDRWGGLLSLAGLFVEVAPLFLGTAFSRKGRR